MGGIGPPQGQQTRYPAHNPSAEVAWAVFLPMTFLAGVWGMNFDGMPELHAAWGYPIALTTMLVSGGAMLMWFRTREWW